MTDTLEHRECVMADPRLLMTAGGRLLVRVVPRLSYGVLAVAALIMAMNDVTRLRFAGILLLLFFGDRLLHLGEPERLLTDIPRGPVNVARYFAPASYAAIEAALDRARLTGGEVILHLLKELMARKEVQRGLLRMDVRPAELEEKLDDYIAREKTRSPLPHIREALQTVAVRAFYFALASQRSAIEPQDVFAALGASAPPEIRRLFSLFSVEPRNLEYALLLGNARSARGGVGAVFSGGAFNRRHRIMNRAWTARPTPTLDRFSRDLTDLARLGAGSALFGHEAEYDHLIDVICRPGNPNALLVGEPGAGKGPIVQYLAYQIMKDRVPAPLFDKRLVLFEVGAVMSGANEGELARRVNLIVQEIVTAGNVILYIPDIHNLLKTSGPMQMSAADVLIPAIKGTGFSVIGGTYSRELKQYLEPASDFMGSFETIRVEEISEDAAIKFLAVSAAALEATYKILISFHAIQEAVRIAHAYFRQSLLPQSAEELLKDTLADAAERGKDAIGVEDVVRQAEKRVNVPLHHARAAEASVLLNLEKTIHERLIDQEPAVTAVARALREYRSGLARKGGPIAQFLFVGPTGVGKTELAKIVAEIMFGSVRMMTRFDMSEYQTKESISLLIGSPDGTVRGALTDAVYEKPYGLLLLDEFEKAHPDLLNLFLQVFDDGRLTDNFGRTVDFQNAIIIATSNAHADILLDALRKGESVPTVADYLKTKLVDIFKPELLNRFTDIIVFRELASDHLRAIARIQLGGLVAALKTEHQIELTCDEAAIAELARRGYDPVFGARPLRRAIADAVRGPLAEKILKGELKQGMNVHMAFQDGAFTFTGEIP